MEKKNRPSCLGKFYQIGSLMVHRYYRLPSLTSLVAFEAAARHRSLKRGAEELNVTPGAISRQVKLLEDELGVSLFLRAQTGLVLTAEGEELYAVLSHIFSRAAETVETIRSGTQRVTLACTNAFATRWLMPRMGDFWRRYPEITVDHLITDDARNFRRTEVDLRIRYGSGAWPDEASTLLLDETIYPISSPAYASEHLGATAADIPELSLLHVDWVDGMDGLGRTVAPRIDPRTVAASRRSRSRFRRVSRSKGSQSVGIASSATSSLLVRSWPSRT